MRGLLVFVGVSALSLACSDGAMVPMGETIPTADAGAAIAPDAQVPETSTPPDAALPPVPDVDALPWDTSAGVGHGVARKDTKNPLGNSMFVAYGGYGVSLALTQTWASAFYKAELASRGVSHIWAVQGPNTPTYTNLEIGNSKIAEAMVPWIDGATKFVLVLGHSSGSFVAQELLDQLAGPYDPSGATDHRIVYFALDGGGGFSEASFAHAERFTFVGAHDGTNLSANHDDMMNVGAAYPSKGGFWDHDAKGSGCNAGAKWCMHMTLINQRPHEASTSDVTLDYGQFDSQHPLATGWFDANAKSAGIL